MTLTAVLIAVALLVGYALGRVRPYNRLGDWADWQLRFHLDRWASKPRQAALLTLLLLTDPFATVHAWRHRKDHPPPRSPALQIDPDWVAKRRAATTEET
ncbi:hypothetical protein ACFQ0X_43845 [Streptomyces rectiviolaceus]|uniref:hypothetical protein n=1 Tax=Streptomyces rectiviolaceus TaxID=332591 RepID=UPI003644CAF4